MIVELLCGKGPTSFCSWDDIVGICFNTLEEKDVGVRHKWKKFGKNTDKY